jgi:hypothetical protein
MSFVTLFEKIVGKQRERQQSHQADFRDLVRMIADGQEPDAETVERVLRDNGESFDGLRAAVERLLHRRELRQRVDALPALRAERTELEAKINKADRVLEAAEKRHDEATSPLYARLNEVKAARLAGEAARRDLVTTCDYVELCDRMNYLEKLLRDALDRRADAHKRIRELRAGAASDRRQAEYEPEVDAKGRRERAAERDAKAAEFEAAMPAIVDEIARLECEQAEVREQMLVP